MDNKAYIALGSNIGNREEIITRAIESLANDEKISVEKISSIYETPPVGYTEQDNFLNAVVEILTDYSPEELLHVLQSLENNFGRVRKIRWGPRTIDLDILLYNDENIKTNHLIIPHPRMFDRAFVMVPFLEICPTYQVAISLEQLPDFKGVNKYGSCLLGKKD